MTELTLPWVFCMDDHEIEMLAERIATKIHTSCPMNISSADVIFLKGIRKRVEGISQTFWDKAVTLFLVMVAAVLLSGFVARLTQLLDKRGLGN